MCSSWDVSVCICTYNRCETLRSALESVLGQEADGVRFEVIVVDNNSTDDTKQVVQSFVRRGHLNLQYSFEGRQGLSHARNAGTAMARSPVVAFTDDDIRVAPDWVSTIKRAFDEYPEAAWVGGRVLPCWPAPPPRWLTANDWGPLALADHGDVPFYTSSHCQTGLVGANLAVRRDVLQQFGGFAPRLQRVQDSIGSMEDHELQMRLWRAQRKGLYVPELVVFSDVSADRLLKKYHRRWHFGHGRFYALARLEEYECSSVGWLFGVSAHVYRRAIRDLVQWVVSVVRGNFRRAFRYEKEIWFFLGFWSVHYKEFLEHGRRTHIGEISRFGWMLTSRLFGRALLGARR